MKTALRVAPLHGCGRTPLAVAFATAFALAAPPAMATVHTWTVNTCNEGVSGVAGSYTGSLRFAANNAGDGDTIDITGLDLICSQITLQTGAIVFAQNNLTVNGPGTYDLSINCERRGPPTYECTDRIFDHTGTGTLQINNLRVSGGYVYSTTGPANGGCIYSSGSLLQLEHVNVEDCVAATKGQTAAGGGIFAKNALTLKYSNVRTNLAGGGGAGSNAIGIGGGAAVVGDFLMVSSTISDNHAFTAQYGGSSPGSHGGGLHLAGNVTIEYSTISGNYSDRNQGGIDIYNTHPSSLSTLILNSTISGNGAADVTGGLYVNSGAVRLYNSTIAFNTAGQGSYGTATNSPGLSISANFSPTAVTLKSSLLANNTYGASPGVDNDLSTINANGHTVTFNTAPANNLVYGTFITGGLPSDTLSACPLLGPLRNNGGLTKTHALLSHSPAIGMGNNSQHLNEDQRGLGTDTAPYPYPRVSPTTGKTDIGAYEVQQADIIFNNGFDGCP